MFIKTVLWKWLMLFTPVVVLLVKGFCVSCFWYGFMSVWPKSETLLVVALKYLFPVLQKPDSIYYPTKSQLSVLHFERF